MANKSKIIERNRKNALRSTGPTSPEGKVATRRNALKHGLCGNPAAGVVEDPKAFEALHNSLIDRIVPRDAIEEGCVHTIATCIWRLQRATKVEAAACNLAVRSQSTSHSLVQGWYDRIFYNFGTVERVEIQNINKVSDAVRQRAVKVDDKWIYFELSFLKNADAMRKLEMMNDSAALEAMACLIEDLVEKLDAHCDFSYSEAWLLAWLLGESAARLLPPEKVEHRWWHFYPDECDWATPTDVLIGQARKRSKSEPISDVLLHLVRVQLTKLRAQSRQAKKSLIADQEVVQQTMALLPDTALLDKLMRYETHADRRLQRALERLAMLRGSSVQALWVSITTHNYDQQALKVPNQRVLDH
ncbi:MAG: hypothetical protein IT445_00970 [Phycisphaeraceae bacterium]|nr:hypothetical protein [Phycisphaeraceae bacterium]